MSCRYINSTFVVIRLEVKRLASPFLLVMAFLILAWNASGSAAAKRPCTKSEANRADEDVDLLKDWDHVYRSYKKFSQCDDGAIAEGYSDAITKLLAKHWGNFGHMAALSNADKGFERFVLKHIDQTVSDDTLLTISNNARDRCPAQAQRLCRLVIDAASSK